MIKVILQFRDQSLELSVGKGQCLKQFKNEFYVHLFCAIYGLEYLSL